MNPTTVSLKAPPTSPRDRLRYLDRLQTEAAEIISEAFPRRGLKRMGKLRFQISRARAGADSNPAFRLVTWFEQLRESGQSLEGADRVLSWLEGRVDALRAASEVDLDQLSLAEQLVDGAEDHAQLRAKHGSPDAVRGWIRTMDLHIASQRACRSAARLVLRSRTVGA